jgi:preprotein translocase subunit SecY
MNKILRVFKIKDLRNRILFVLGLLLVFQLLSSIPVPGVDLVALKAFFEQNTISSQIVNMVNVFTGGGISKFSIVMLGVGPYITASIVMQLLTMIFPRLEELYKEEGEQGRAKFNQYTRYLTVPLAILNAFGYITMFKGGSQPVIGNISILQEVGMITVITAGTMFLMWLGELITEKNIGNGTSIIIFAGIVSRLPSSFQKLMTDYDPSSLMTYVMFALLFLVVIVGVIIMTEGQRNIPISYAKRITGSKLYGGSSTYLPLRVNQVGVIPIIFAMSIMLFPGMIANFLQNVHTWNLDKISAVILPFFQNTNYVYNALYFILVVLFTYFYSSVTFDPKQIAENLQRQGGFIPGIRPGDQTAHYLGKTLNRIILAGALFLGVIAILPNVISRIVTDQGISSSGLGALTIGGTSLLIVVSVAIETIKQIESQLVIRNYDET